MHSSALTVAVATVALCVSHAAVANGLSSHHDETAHGAAGRGYDEYQGTFISQLAQTPLVSFLQLANPASKNLVFTRRGGVYHRRHHLVRRAVTKVDGTESTPATQDTPKLSPVQWGGIFTVSLAFLAFFGVAVMAGKVKNLIAQIVAYCLGFIGLIGVSFSLKKVASFFCSGLCGLSNVAGAGIASLSSRRRPSDTRAAEAQAYQFSSPRSITVRQTPRSADVRTITSGVSCQNGANTLDLVPESQPAECSKIVTASDDIRRMSSVRQFSQGGGSVRGSNGVVAGLFSTNAEDSFHSRHKESGSRQRVAARPQGHIVPAGYLRVDQM
ncbi:hypothetical protein SeMB42_g00706 [Synchytrium endobioticum]|uniref:Uncharacterized protein n=1 Tax=Synchytrium endobioticum TaxID=286115 RepID=A0A507DPA8_9FUNG|nr:hypothetical protein SeMB42_g00706 [Synchytrium endobioticum]